MKMFLGSLLGLLLAQAAFAGESSESVISCKDEKGRLVGVSRITSPYSRVDAAAYYIATVTKKPGTVPTPRPVTLESFDPTYPMEFVGDGIKIRIDSIQLSDIPYTQARGTVRIRGDRKPVMMLCEKGPAFGKKN